MNIQTAKKVYSQLVSAYQATQQAIDIDLTQWIDPSRGVYCFLENNSKALDGSLMLDTLPMDAVEVYASGFMSYMTDPSSTWFKVITGDQDLDDQHDVIDFSAAVSKVLRSIIEGSNLYPEFLNVYAEHGVFGRSPLVITHDFDTIVQSTFYTAGSYVIGKDKKGRINQFACKMRKDAMQLVDEFGIDNVNDNVKQAFSDSNQAQYFDVIWLITPNTQKERNRKDFRNMNFLSLKWIECTGDENYLSAAGFDSFPVAIARYHPKDNTQIYGGKYPGYLARPASKQLQALCRGANKIDDFNINPVFAAYGGIDVDSLYPGAIIPIDLGMAQTTGGKVGLEQVTKNQDSNYIETRSDRQREAIKRPFLVQFFQMLSSLSDKQMTLGEVNQRYAEMVKSIAPQILGIESFLNQVLEIILHILTTNYSIIDGENVTLLESLCGPIPESLQGTEIKFRFLGILSILQRASETMSDEQLIQFITYLVSALQDPINNPMDLIDGDLMVRAYADRIGRAANLRGDDIVQSIRDARKQAMSAQQQQQDAQNSIQAAQVMANTPIADNTALGAVMGVQK
jgi:hypothetical protein